MVFIIMEFPALEKYIQTMNIDITMDVERDFIDKDGNRYICVGVIALYQEEETYVQYFCYSLGKSGRIHFEDGNDVKGAGDGVFAYLANDNLVNEYFENKARRYAKRYFERS